MVTRNGMYILYWTRLSPPVLTKLEDHREEACALVPRVLTNIVWPEKMTNHDHVRW